MTCHDGELNGDNTMRIPVKQVMLPLDSVSDRTH